MEANNVYSYNVCYSVCYTSDSQINDINIYNHLIT